MKISEEVRERAAAVCRSRNLDITATDRDALLEAALADLAEPTRARIDARNSAARLEMLAEYEARIAELEAKLVRTEGLIEDWRIRRGSNEGVVREVYGWAANELERVFLDEQPRIDPVAAVLGAMRNKIVGGNEWADRIEAALKDREEARRG